MICTIIGIGFVIYVLVGWVRGLFKVMISVAGLIASIVIAAYVAPHLSGFLQENTQIDDNIASYIAEELQFSDLGEETSKGIQVALINELPLPESMKESILNNNNSDMYKVLEVSGIYDYIAKSVAVVILNALVFLILVFFCKLLFFFLGKAVKEFTSLPIIKGIDKLGGGLLGAIQGVIVIWIFFLILSVFSASEWAKECILQINQNLPLKLLYENNILLDIVGDLTKVLFL